MMPRNVAWIAALSVLSVSLLLPTIAMASPCGGSSGSSGGGSSSGGSSSSSGSSGSSDGGSSSSGSSACVNSTSIIGRAECTRFGTWDRSVLARMRLSMGLIGGTTSVAGMEFDGQVEHQQVHKYHYPTQSVRSGPAQANLAGMELQASGFVSDHWHVGVHTSFGIGGSDAQERQFGELSIAPGMVVQLSAAGTIGASIPAGSWILRSDALIGVRATNMSFTSRHGDCVKFTSAWNNELMIEPRVGIERWLNPWLSAGVMVGSDLLQQRDVSIAIGFTGHTTPFDSSGVVGLFR
jgi:hypothetical protein